MAKTRKKAAAPQTVTQPSEAMDQMLKERRVFKPSKEFSKAARVGSLAAYKKLYNESIKSPDKFWAKVGKELHWFKPFKKVLDWSKAPFAKWFVGGTTNLSYNCLDRHLTTSRRNKAALIWEGEPGDSRTLTYDQLHREVCKFANVLKGLGVGKGDRVAIYMPMVPELPIALLACARIGAPHSVIFGGFSATALVDRIHDCSAKAVVTADGGWRRGKIVELKKAVDEAMPNCPTVQKVVVLKRTGQPVEMKDGRDVWWHETMAGASPDCKAEPLDAEHPLYILYTSGSTGKPKGIYHTTGGYMVGTYLTSKLVFDLRDEDVYFCTADIGWVTGHSYIVYGPLANGATSLMYEGAPNHPGPDRFWEIVAKYRVNIFYTAPTAIRAFIKWGDQHPAKHDLSSLRLLGTVGEPINPEAWIWYNKVIGGKRCPIVDTWWQTETGAIMISPVPGAVPTKPGSATLPMPGVLPEVVDPATKEKVPPGGGGILVIRKPWPSMLRGLWGDNERYKQVYWSTVPGSYFTGDGAHCDKDGYFWIMGRVDDVINVSGHRLGTAEVESALVSHPAVAESACIGVPDEITGQAIAAFVTVKEGHAAGDDLKADLLKHVTKEIGALARPKQVRFTGALPKTRSGKIMRRLLRDIASGKERVGDTTTLEDYSVLAKLRESDEG
ncbi:MAG: acetate--CoA ligase [Planctomycetes bacterium]|nr:acetate--CoA ligase [Planctomycetota bacterium]